MRIQLKGAGGHGSRPEASIDPVVMAAALVMRLQGIVAREIAATDVAVVTVGALNAGTKANIIPGEAELLLGVRTVDLGQGQGAQRDRRRGCLRVLAARRGRSRSLRRCHQRSRVEALTRKLPSNHSPLYAPVAEPTIRIGVSALVSAAQCWMPADDP